MSLRAYEDFDLEKPYSVEVEPYQPGYRPIFHDVIFNATEGDTKIQVIYVASDEEGDYCYVEVRAQPEETAAFQRDPDKDGVNEFHMYVSKPVEHTQPLSVFAVGDGATIEFNLPHRWIKPESEEIRIGDQLLERNVDYFINYSMGHIKFVDPPPNGYNIYAAYKHADGGSGEVDIPPEAVIKANGDFEMVDLWSVPQRYDSNRGVGYEVDRIPVVILAEVDPNTTDEKGRAVTLWHLRLKFKAWEVNAKL